MLSARERDHVWHGLRQLGSAVREPGFYGEAQLVCDGMARRARHNIEVIIERLTGPGYLGVPQLSLKCHLNPV